MHKYEMQRWRVFLERGDARQREELEAVNERYALLSVVVLLLTNSLLIVAAVLAIASLVLDGRP